MSDWGKRMVDVWYNKGLDPENRLTWEQFYIEQFKDMEQDAEACKHNISAAKHETRDRCGATWTSLSSPCPS